MPSAVIDAAALFAPLRGRRAVGLAVSGGADSLALMLLAARWAASEADAAPRLIVYSVDHALRPEAADEVHFVLGAATALGLGGRGLRWDGDKPDTGVQASAREARYRLMAAAMADDGADLLLTAHHREDQAETVLMRLAHGSGVEGLKGMASFTTVQGCRIYRPFLDVARQDLRAVVADAGLTPVEDPSNTDTDYERVRWRAMLPSLADMGVTPARLAKFSRRMAEIDEMVELATNAALSDIVHRRPDGTTEVGQAAFAALPRPVAVRLLARLLAGVGGARKPHALSVVEALQARLMADGTLKRLTLHGCFIEADCTTIHISPEPGRSRDAERQSVTAH